MGNESKVSIVGSNIEIVEIAVELYVLKRHNECGYVGRTLDETNLGVTVRPPKNYSHSSI